MAEIFVNLKRFDVPRDLGGICPNSDPQEWIDSIMETCVELGLGKLENSNIAFLLPEGLVATAKNRLDNYEVIDKASLSIGVQGVFRKDVKPGGNFGAFTSNLPAAAAKNLGRTWTMIAHSEERRDKLEIIEEFEPNITTDDTLRVRAAEAVNKLINEEVCCAFEAGLNVLLCVGETAEERGDGTFEEQQPRIESVLKTQLSLNLEGVVDKMGDRKIVIGYEPIWAIGPGKTPPGAEYISFVSEYIKATAKELFGLDIPVVYGGGLKEENAPMLGGIPTIDGGLIALTRFTQPIAFTPQDLKIIVDKYIEAETR